MSFVERRDLWKVWLKHLSTDAVLRYLLVQYGITPQDLIGMEDGALIGDVLCVFLPTGDFRS